MKKTFTKALLALAVVCFIFAIAPMIGSDLPGIDPAMTARAATVVDSGSCGANVTYVLDNDGTLTISGTGDMEDYYNPHPWYSYCTPVQNVIIGDGITSIGDYAFSGCTSLTSVTIPDSVTSIGYDAFSGCTSLTSVTIPDSVTSIGGSAFENCTSLTSVTIPDSVTSIGFSAFAWCTSLTSVTIGDSVTSIGDYTFFHCTSLTGITVDANNEYYASANGVLYNKDKTTLISYPAGKTETSFVIPDNVTSIEDYAFFDCTSLTSVTIPDSVTSIATNAFLGCTSLTSVTIPDSVTSIGDYAFYWCESLTSVTIPDSVTSIGDDAFSNCTSLTSVTIGDSVTSIGDRVFNNCPSLTSVTIPDSVTSIGQGAFCHCTSLIEITVDADNKYYASANGVLYNKDKTTLICYPTGKTESSFVIPDNVTSIGYGAFYYCTSLTEITVPENVISIDAAAFAYCSSLEKITIENPDCEIFDSADTISYNATIYGYAGSTAQAYAEKYDRTFVALEPAWMPGDIDKDGEITAGDARTVLRAAVGLATLTEAEYEVADVDKDGTLTAGDARSILRCAVGLETF